MRIIELPDALHQQLAEAAALRGKTVEVFTEELLSSMLRSIQSVPSQNLAAMLLEARQQIEREGTPLFNTWPALEAEVAERRGGEYETTS